MDTSVKLGEALQTVDAWSAYVWRQIRNGDGAVEALRRDVIDAIADAGQVAPGTMLGMVKQIQADVREILAEHRPSNFTATAGGDDVAQPILTCPLCETVLMSCPPPNNSTYKCIACAWVQEGRVQIPLRPKTCEKGWHWQLIENPAYDLSKPYAWLAYPDVLDCSTCRKVRHTSACEMKRCNPTNGMANWEPRQKPAPIGVCGTRIKPGKICIRPAGHEGKCGDAGGELSVTETGRDSSTPPICPTPTTDSKGRLIPSMDDEHKRFVRDSIALTVNDEQACIVKMAMDDDWHVRDVTVHLTKIADDKSVMLDAVHSSGQRETLMA